jgi:Cu-processing system permease protein
MPTLIIARLTFLEALRRRIVLAALVLGAGFLVLYGIGVGFMQRELAIASPGPAVAGTLVRTGFASFLGMAGLYAVNFLAIAMAALVTADTLAGEISSGTIQALVTKPLRRAEIVLGKWLGLAVLLGLYLALMAGSVLLIVYIIAGYVVPGVPAGLALIYLEVLLVMSLALACSSTFSTLATGGIVFGMWGIAFIGGWVEQIGAVMQAQTAINVGIISGLLMPSEALWRRASYEMTPPLAQSLDFSMAGPFLTTSVPSPLAVAYAALYLVAAMAIAVRRFNRRDL